MYRLRGLREDLYQKRFRHAEGSTGLRGLGCRVSGRVLQEDGICARMA